MEHMKKKLTFIFLTTAISLLSFSAVAQKNGISFSFLNAALYAKASPFTQGYMGIGFERNVGDYISLKVEINKGFNIFYKITDGKILSVAGSNDFDKTVVDSTGEYSTFMYHWSLPSFEINYQSKFFFRGNEETGAYLAMGIGFRSVKYVFHTGGVSGDYYNDDEAPKDIEKKNEYTESLTLIPLVLRIGARGDLKGFYPDFSFGMGYNISHSKTITDETIVEDYELTVPKLSGLALSASISFGIGW
jgi:hypothetical protein